MSPATKEQRSHFISFPPIARICDPCFFLARITLHFVSLTDSAERKSSTNSNQRQLVNIPHFNYLQLSPFYLYPRRSLCSVGISATLQLLTFVFYLFTLIFYLSDNPPFSYSPLPTYPIFIFQISIIFSKFM